MAASSVGLFVYLSYKMIIENGFFASSSYGSSASARLKSFDVRRGKAVPKGLKMLRNGVLICR